VTPEKTKLWYLRNLEAFRHLKEEELQLLDRHSRMRNVKRGEVLYLQGSAKSNIYILKSGAVKITKVNPEGKEIIIDIIKGGSLLGEMAVVEPQVMDESAEVVEDGVLCTMRREDFEKVARSMPGLSAAITKLIAFRRRRIENKLLALVYSSVEQRLARTLLSLVEDFGVPRNGGSILRIRLTHGDFADLIASTRETVTAVLNRLRNDGLIDFEGKRLEVKSVERLRAIAG
jgi:CRP/FNR family cyclic AMP-dependent transcriptional regulator